MNENLVFFMQMFRVPATSCDKYHEIFIQLSYLFKIVRTRPMHLTTFRVNIWGHFITTLINRVNIHCFQYHESCIQVLYLFRVVRKWLRQLTTFRIPTLINRVKYIISNTMRLLYKCHTFLESSV